MKNIYVGNLDYQATEEELRKLFEPFGIVERVSIPRDTASRARGFAFVEMEDENERLFFTLQQFLEYAVNDQLGTGFRLNDEFFCSGRLDGLQLQRAGSAAVTEDDIKRSHRVPFPKRSPEDVAGLATCF